MIRRLLMCYCVWSRINAFLELGHTNLYICSVLGVLPVNKEPVADSQFTEVILPCEILQRDIPDMWTEIIFYNFFLFQSVYHQYKRFIQTACFPELKILLHPRFLSWGKWIDGWMSPW